MLPRTRWLRKPPVGAKLNPAHWFAASGIKGGWLLNEVGAKATLRDFSPNGSIATFVGAPTWSSGPGGPQLGGFTTSDYAQADSFAGRIGTAYPFWIACVFTSTSTGASVPFGFDNSGSNNQVANIFLNLSGAGDVCYFLRDNAGSGPDSTNHAVQSTTNDGNPHLAYGISYASNDHRVGFDGVQIGSNSTAISAPITFNTCSIGVLHRLAIAFALTGSVIWAAFGQGAVPNFASLWADLWGPCLTPNYRRWYPPSPSPALDGRRVSPIVMIGSTFPYCLQ